MIYSGSGPFDNKDAHDFIFELQRSGGAAYLQGTLESAASTDAGVLGSELGATAIAAAATVALAAGCAGVLANDDVSEWIRLSKFTPDRHLVFTAVRACQRVLAPLSVLDDLWKPKDDYKDWNAMVAALTAALQAKLS